MPFVKHKHAEKIAALNDRFRQSFRGGIVVLSELVKALSPLEKGQLFRSVKSFSNFGDENDPYREHDFGCIWFQGERFYFQISCYDLELKKRSAYPHKISQTKRLMMITRHDELQTTSLCDSMA